MPTIVIDYSQYKDFLFCPWYWYYKHVLKLQLKATNQRSDAMALGSLVHNGLENWHRSSDPFISEETITEVDPTLEILAAAQAAVAAYVARYPVEPWKAVAIEKPLIRDYDWFRLVAKLDAYTVITEQVEVSDGLGGVIVLVPGVYGIEHKTKAEQIEPAKYIGRWEVNRQASFQMLALQALQMARTWGFDPDPSDPLPMPVNGIIINVIDKPREYVPKRKCKSCGSSSELSAWLFLSEDKWSCPMCGAIQQLSPYKPRTEKKFDFWRFLVTRSEDELIDHEYEITNVAGQMRRFMEGVNVGGVSHWKDLTVPNSENCVNPITYRKCQYFNPDKYKFDIIGHPDYEPTQDYLGIENVNN